MSLLMQFRLERFMKDHNLSSLKTELSIPGVPLTKGRMTVLPDAIRVDEQDGGYVILPMTSVVEMRLDARPVRIVGKPEAYVRSLPSH